MGLKHKSPGSKGFVILFPQLIKKSKIKMEKNKNIISWPDLTKDSTHVGDFMKARQKLKKFCMSFCCWQLMDQINRSVALFSNY